MSPKFASQLNQKKITKETLPISGPVRLAAPYIARIFWKFSCGEHFCKLSSQYGRGTGGMAGVLGEQVMVFCKFQNGVWF